MFNADVHVHLSVYKIYVCVSVHIPCGFLMRQILLSYDIFVQYNEAHITSYSIFATFAKLESSKVTFSTILHDSMDTEIFCEFIQ